MLLKEFGKWKKYSQIINITDNFLSQKNHIAQNKMYDKLLNFKILSLLFNIEW